MIKKNNSIRNNCNNKIKIDILYETSLKNLDVTDRLRS